MKKAPPFPLGESQITPGAEAVLTPPLLAESLQRHQHGDYGEIDPEDAHQNQRGLAQCGMIMSVYQTPDGTAYWIQTHGTRSRSRSHTLILLPGE
jgi:hypothetical protein